MKKKQIPNKNTNLLYTYTIKTYKDLSSSVHMSLPILIYLHVYFFAFKTPDPTTSSSKVLIPGTRLSTSSKK